MSKKMIVSEWLTLILPRHPRRIFTLLLLFNCYYTVWTLNGEVRRGGRLVEAKKEVG